MKSLFISLLVALLSFAPTTGVSAACGNVSGSKTSVSRSDVPANIIVKQTVVFDDNTSVVVYYKKSGNTCQVYSTNNLNKYGMGDLLRVKSSNFEKCSAVQGKCYGTKSVKQVIALIKSAANAL